MHYEQFDCSAAISANDLWSLYGNEAKSHDESRINTLKDDMDYYGGSLSSYVQNFLVIRGPGLTSLSIQAGLSGVLTAFVVPKIQAFQDLKVNPADQSVYYHNQSAQMLDQIQYRNNSLRSAARSRQILHPHCLTRPFIRQHLTVE